MGVAHWQQTLVCRTTAGLLRVTGFTDRPELRHVFRTTAGLLLVIGFTDRPELGHKSSGLQQAYFLSLGSQIDQNFARSALQNCSLVGVQPLTFACELCRKWEWVILRQSPVFR